MSSHTSIERFFFIPRHDTGAIIEVTGVWQGGQRPHRVIASELWQTLHEIIQLIQVPALIWKHNTQLTEHLWIIHIVEKNQMESLLGMGTGIRVLT